ncbi:YjbH domain-containing protein [Pseudogemmobacter bohemicus]|uniref:YjbH domain-containing protein n=1 Tax=Pseudogemmobacter bohemicus TaxID=2250708 RepID=UPI000DD3F5EB|nr:YjbH domain-containing protein [Pseudogemmobacter bohemicus]
MTDLRLPRRMPCCATLTGALLLAMVAGVAKAEAPSQILSWGYNSFGSPGLIDMPTAQSREDGEFGLTLSYFSNQTRATLTFQVSDRLSASFRYSNIENLRPNLALPWKIEDRIDRSFSVHYRFMDEGIWLPAMAVGINDLVGSGIYGGEYVVATKTINPRLRASIGLGWGRLGSYGGFSNTLGVVSSSMKTRPNHSDGLGGTFEPELWFRGDAALFGGIEWQVNDRLRLIAEYSSDAYEREDGLAFDHKSPVNLGVEWRYSDRLNISANYLYGSEIGIGLNWAFNPKRSRHGSGREAAPPPVLPASAAAAKSWGDISQIGFEGRLSRDLGREGLDLEGLEARGTLLRVNIRNNRYAIAAQAVGRAARVMSRIAPAEVSRFEIILSQNGMPVTSVTVQRSDLEELEFHTVAPDLLRVNTVITDTRDPLNRPGGIYPRFSYGLAPYLTPSFFDPDDPLRLDVGVALNGRFEPLPGIVFSGQIRQKIIGNLDKGDRASTSVLPRVRSESYLYYKGGDTTLQDLTGAWYFRPAPDFFGRVTLGYLESMFGGVSTEILWKPQNSALALGVEINYVRQRDFDQMFGFQDYAVTTGHVSAYYEMAGGYQAQLDVGRYLAGDFGATLTLSREFDNGWKVGLFATKTDVSAEDFGEGSFDKGVLLTIPLDWVTGRATQERISQTIRPVQRDGGARLIVPGRLYEGVRNLQATELDPTWGRFWK